MPPKLSFAEMLNKNNEQKSNHATSNNAGSNIIDRMYLDASNQDGYETRKACIRSERVPIIGDKYCSVHAPMGCTELHTELGDQMKKLPIYFDLSQEREILECYDKYGVVAITGILSLNEVNETVNDIDDAFEEMCGDNFSFQDEKTYDLITNSHMTQSFGMFGEGNPYTPLLRKQIIKNRFHSNVQKAFSIVYGMKSEDMVVHHDRLLWMRKTVGRNGENLGKYRTVLAGQGIHLDIDLCGYFDDNIFPKMQKKINSFTYSDLHDFVSENNIKNLKMGRQVRGLLNILDNRVEDGGFQCVPGGHLVMKQWYEKYKNSIKKKESAVSGNFIFGKDGPEFRMDMDDKFIMNGTDYKLGTVRIPCPAGTLILFDILLPHGSRPNYTNRNRIAQPILYSPKSNWTDSKTLAKRKKMIQRILREINYTPTEEEKKVV
jgi:Phytanoyl-CoA dioxygenase (PhyH)